jgi:hypothetical protein
MDMMLLDTMAFSKREGDTQGYCMFHLFAGRLVRGDQGLGYSINSVSCRGTLTEK